MKGIYKREKSKRKRDKKGDNGIKKLYKLKDIKLLLNENIIWKMREYKVFEKKMGKERGLKDYEKIKRKIENRKNIKLDKIVKERYK
jgi:pescadillo protein